MKKRTFFAVAVLLVLLLAACGGTAEESPAPAPDSGGAAAPDSGGSSDAAFDLIVVNQSSYEICFAYLSPSDSEEWGADQLQDETIAAGGQFTLKNIPAGTYDALFEPCDENAEPVERYGIEVDSDIRYTLTD